MKIIGTCKECKHWDGENDDLSARCGELEADVGHPIKTAKSFGCIHWEEIPPKPGHWDDISDGARIWVDDNPNYPTRTAQDLEIADLKRENNAAFERIQELSAELVRLGFDPTAKT